MQTLYCSLPWTEMISSGRLFSITVYLQAYLLFCGQWMWEKPRLFMETFSFLKKNTINHFLHGKICVFIWIVLQQYSWKIKSESHHLVFMSNSVFLESWKRIIWQRRDSKHVIKMTGAQNQRLRPVMISTLDSGSNDSSSNLGRTFPGFYAIS
jgi:hypothetical protein